MDNFKTTALIGFTGFVGSTLYLAHKFTDVYNSKNINNITNKEYDCIVCAGISAKKWYANLHPEEDLEQINKLLDVLKTVKASKFILISTIDIYDNVSAEFDEDYIPDINYNHHAYGKNRLYVENFIKQTYINYTIIRLPGLFGFGLQKNIIYDYLNNTLKELNINSSFQWYDISDLYNDINKILTQNIKLINLFTEPIKNSELLDIFLTYNNNLNVTQTTNNSLNYNMLTKYIQSGYYYTKINILEKLERYIDRMKNNRLLIGNLSWNHNNNLEMLTKLKATYGINSLEIAPYKYFGTTIDKVNSSNIIKEFDIYSFQAIFYPLTENIFESESDRNKLETYLYKTIDIASNLNVKVLVFGSPKNRKRNNLSYEEALNVAIPFFKKVGDYAIQKNVIVCIEPNAKQYNCDFITNSIEGRELVLKVNSDGFKLHLDVGCMLMENENVMECIFANLDILKHIHFSAPGLKSLIENKMINYNELLDGILKVYDGRVAIEMLNQDDYDVLRNIRYCLL